MAKRDRRREEPVEPDVFLLGRISRRFLAGVEHVGTAHAEIAAKIVQLAKVEIDEPGVHRGPVGLVLAVVAVGQSAVERVVVALGVNRSVPRLLLMEHDLAERVEDGREGPRAGNASVVIDAIPGSDRRVDVAVGGAEMELRLDLRASRAQYSTARAGFGA